MALLWYDLRHAARSLRRTPIFSLVVILTLALASGPSTALFSFLNAAYLRPLPVAKPEQLVRLHTGFEGSGESQPMSYLDFIDFRAQTAELLGLAASAFIEVQLGEQTDQHPVRAALVSGEYFSLLGVPMVAGREIGPDEERGAGSGTAAVISHSLWQSRFGGERAIVGQPLFIDGISHTIIGVAATGFRGIDFGNAVDIWVPLSRETSFEPPASYVKHRDAKNLAVIGRIRPGASLAQLQGVIKQVAKGLAERYPETNARQTATLALMVDGERRGLPVFLLALMGVVGSVLLIACANIANLFLVRAASRQGDAAIRLALGASRGRLIRQVLLESFLLSIVGAGFGLLLAVWGGAALRAFDLTDALDIRTDLRVLAFTLLVGIVAGMGFGVGGAYRSSRLNLAGALRDHGPATGSRRATGADVLVVAQLSLLLVLVTGTSLLVRSIDALREVDPGFAANELLMVRVRFSEVQRPVGPRDAFYIDLLDRVRAIPGVQGASGGEIALLSGAPPLVWPLEVPDYSYGPRESRLVQFDVIGPDYFRTVGLSVVGGNDFTIRDHRGWPPRQVVVNESFADRFFPGRNPIGRTLLVKEKHPAEIIGVVRDARLEDVRDRAAPRFYVSFLSVPNDEFTLYVRTTGHPRAVTLAVMQVIGELDAGVAARAEVTTVADSREASFGFDKAAALVFGGFSTLAVLLAGVGLYGVMAFSVALRTREIGIRMALGARRTDVVQSVLVDAFKLAVAGVIVGGVLAVAVVRLTRSLFYGVALQDAWTLASVGLIFASVVLVASFIPAHRAARVDPMTALRAD